MQVYNGLRAWTIAGVRIVCVCTCSAAPFMRNIQIVSRGLEVIIRKQDLSYPFRVISGSRFNGGHAYKMSDKTSIRNVGILIGS